MHPGEFPPKEAVILNLSIVEFAPSIASAGSGNSFPWKSSCLGELSIGYQRQPGDETGEEEDEEKGRQL